MVFTNLTPFPVGVTPLTNISPLTYRDGVTFLEKLERMRQWLNETLVPDTNALLGNAIEEFQAAITNAEQTILAAKAGWQNTYNTFTADINAIIAAAQADIVNEKVEWQNSFTAFMADVVAQLAALNDESVADLIDNPSSETGISVRTLIDSVKAKKGVDWISVMDYGAVGDGVVDDSVAIQSAANAAYAISPSIILYMPAKTFLINNTINIRSPLEASEATLNYPGSGTALIIGSNVSPVVTYRKKYRCPSVVHTAATKWDGSSIGILAVNLNACELVTPFVQEFEQGLVCMGKGQGFAYTTVFPQSLWGNHKNLVLLQDDIGWCNSNTFNGGRFAQSNVGVAVDDVEYVHVYAVAPPSAASDDPNNNTFVGCSFEADSRHYYRIVMAGYANTFLNCRWEAIGGSIPRILWKDGSANNRIIGGYDANKIVEIYEGVFSGGPSAINDNARIYCKAVDVSGKMVPSGVSTVVDTWSGFLGHRATIDSVKGEFKPRFGRWSINAKVSFNGQPVPTGYLQAQLVVGSTVLDIVRINPGTQINTLKLYGSHNFNGTDVFKILVSQTSGVDLGIATTVGYTTIEANYYPV